MQLGFHFEDREPEEAQPDEPTAPRVYSVGELTRAVRETLEAAIGEVWVRGEISNYRWQASGHQYFTLKDDVSQLPCVLFAGSARGMRRLKLADGAQVQVFGELTVYEARGQYQLVVRLVQEEGHGALQAKLEALKAKLAAEGLFDAERKRPLPRFPRRIGVVTSPTGAAIRDFLHVLHRRYSGVEVVIHPVRVQGRGAAAEIAAAVEDFSGAPENGYPAVDVIVVTRGGGSLEDLWEFNEEVVVRAIADSAVPVVSAVGHEIDFALSDFAADLRAPTPSAAAELLAPDGMELKRMVADRAMRLRREVAGVLRFHRARLEALARSALYREPERFVRERRQEVDRLQADAARCAAECIRSCREALARAVSILEARKPSAVFPWLRERLSETQRRLGDLARRDLAKYRERIAAQNSALRALSPEGTLARGYSITLDSAGQVLRSVSGLRPGDRVRTRLADGEVESEVQKTRGATNR